MKIEKYIVSMIMAAAMMLAVACSSDNNETSIDQPEVIATKTIPYSVTVSNGSFTRASLDGNQTAYVFEAGDKLYVKNSDGTVYGTLTLEGSDAGKSTDVTFSGTMHYTGNTPDTGLELTAVLKSGTDEIVTLDSNNEKVTGFTYPTTAVASTIEEAVRKYSKFTATSTYGAKLFLLEQESTFLSFSITLKDGTANNSSLGVSISNNNSEVRTGSTTTSIVGGEVKAQFVAAFPNSTQLTNASVTLGSIPISFGGSTALVANNIYRVTKGLIDLSSFNTGTSSYTAKKGDVLKGTPRENFMISIEDKATVTLSGIDAGTNTLAITCEGDATIVLAAGTTNTLVGSDNYPGLEIGPSNKTLTIRGTGSLSSTGGYGAAGIGTKYLGVTSETDIMTFEYGNVSIENGTIIAIGGTDAAGIGTGVVSVTNDYIAENKCGNINISGGQVTANGNGYGAGIGTGRAETTYSEFFTGTAKNTCGNISYKESCVTANSGTATSGTAPLKIGKGGYDNNSHANIIQTVGDITKI